MTMQPGKSRPRGPAFAAAFAAAALGAIIGCASAARGPGRAAPAGHRVAASPAAPSTAPSTGPSSPAPRPADAQDDCLAAARPLFYRAVEGDRRALRRCSDLLARCDDADPAKVLAYRGGCAMLESARAALPWDKGAYARRGLTMLDEAVKRSPDDLEVRFVRGMTSYHLPGFFGRSAVAAADLAAVAAEAEAAAADGRLGRSLAAAALFHHGVVLASNGKRPEARDAWRRSAALGPDTRAGRAAAEKLSARGDAAR